jgi:hypothetical protein
MSSYRILLVAAAGVIIICAGVYLAAASADQRVASAAAERDGAQLRAAQAEVERGMTAELRLRAGLLAADGATMAYIADALNVGVGQSVDSASISDVLAERRAQLGLDAIAVIDIGGRYIAGTRPWTDSGGNPARHPLFAEVRNGQQLPIGLVREEARLFLATMVPIARGGTVDAYLYAARAIDAGLLTTLSALAQMDLALVAATPPARLLAHTGVQGEASWTAALERAGAAPLAAARDVVAGNASATLMPLFGNGAQALLLARAPTVRSDSDLLNQPLAALAGALALAWLLLLASWWRAILQPVQSACALLERAARGDFHLRAPPWRRGMRGRFADAFDTLMLRVGSR